MYFVNPRTTIKNNKEIYSQLFNSEDRLDFKNFNPSEAREKGRKNRWDYDNKESRFKPSHQ